MRADRALAATLALFGIAGIAGLWDVLPPALVFVGLAWLPGRAITCAAKAGRDGEAARALWSGPGSLALDVAAALALPAVSLLPCFLVGATLASATLVHAAVLAALGAVVAVRAAPPALTARWLRCEWLVACAALLLLAPMVLRFSGATVDDWWDLAYVRGYTQGALSFAEPMLGTGSVHPRFGWNAWLTLQAVVLRTRMQEAVAFQSGTVALFVCASVVAAQALLAQAFFPAHRRLARVVAIAATPLWLYGTEALPFFTRLHQDKFLAGLVLVPVLLSTVVAAFRSHERYTPALVAMSALALCSVHVLLFAIGLVGAAVLSVTEWVASAPAARRRVLEVWAWLTPFVAYPLVQAWRLRGWFAGEGISLAHPDNPVVRAHLSLERLLWPDSFLYVVHPGAVFGWVACIAGCGAIVCLRRRHDVHYARLGWLALVPAALIFTPVLAGLMGRALVPWMIYRVGWLIPVPQLIGACADGMAATGSWAARAWRLALLVVLASVLVVPTALDRERRTMRDHPSWREWGPRGSTLALYEFLAELPRGSRIVAPLGISNLIPALSGLTTLAQSERATVVFSGDERDAYERLHDRAAFFSSSVGGESRRRITTRYGLTHAVFRRRWITSGSEGRWLASGADAALLELTVGLDGRSWADERAPVLEAVPEGGRVVFENRDFSVVELARAAQQVEDEAGPLAEAYWWAALAPLDTSRPLAGEVLAAWPHYPGAQVSLHPPPLALGASEIALWGTGGAEWEDAPYNVSVVMEVPSNCRVDAVRLVPHVPTGRRELLELRVDGNVGRYRARHSRPIVVAVPAARRRSIAVDIESLLGYPFAVASLELIGSRQDCDGPWAPFARVHWTQLDATPNVWLDFARAYPRHPPLALARRLRESGREKDALAVLRGAFARAPVRAVSTIERGLIEDALGDRHAALASYRRAVRADSNSAWARGCLAWARLRNGDPFVGLWHAWRAATLAHDYADARTIMGIALYDHGIAGLGRRLFDKAIALEPHRSWAYLELARRLARNGDREEALSVLGEYLRLAPLDEDALALADHIVSTGGG